MKRLFWLPLISMLAGCSSIAQSMVNVDEMLHGGRTFDGVRLSRPSSLSLPRPNAPSITVPPGTPDGPFEYRHSKNGMLMKSTIKNGRMIDFVDVYYPNGVLQSHTPLNAKGAEGWSVGYAPDGKLRSRVLFENGQAVRWERYDGQNKKIAEGTFTQN